MSTISPVQFDAEAHVYRVDNTEVLSVTQILKLAGLIDSRWYTPESAIKGQYVATATQMYDEGELDESTLDPALVPYVEAWKRFLSESGAEVVAAESVVYSPTYRYAGTLDRWLILKGRDTIIDIKTGVEAAFHPVQTAGYAGCLKTHFQRGCVYLRDNGTYKFKLHSDPNDRHVFMAALVVAQWKAAHGTTT